MASLNTAVTYRYPSGTQKTILHHPLGHHAEGKVINPLPPPLSQRTGKKKLTMDNPHMSPTQKVVEQKIARNKCQENSTFSYLKKRCVLLFLRVAIQTFRGDAFRLIARWATPFPASRWKLSCLASQTQNLRLQLRRKCVGFLGQNNRTHLGLYHVWNSILRGFWLESLQEKPTSSHIKSLLLVCESWQSDLRHLGQWWV